MPWKKEKNEKNWNGIDGMIVVLRLRFPLFFKLLIFAISLQYLLTMYLRKLGGKTSQ